MMPESLDEIRKAFAKEEAEDRPEVTLEGVTGEGSKSLGPGAIEEYLENKKLDDLIARGLTYKPGDWIRVAVVMDRNVEWADGKFPAIKATRTFVDGASATEGITSGLKTCKLFIDAVCGVDLTELRSFAVRLPNGAPLLLAEYVDAMRSAGFSVYRLLV
jgi:hypothetical protein